MPEQLILATQADGGFETHRKPTRRDVFLAEMDKMVPWEVLLASCATGLAWRRHRR